MIPLLRPFDHFSGNLLHQDLFIYRSNNFSILINSFGYSVREKFR